MTTKKNKPQRPPEIDQAVKEFRTASRAELAKKEVVQFRMDTDDLQKLYQVCALNKKPVGTLVREWVLERIGYESATTNLTANKLEQDIADINCQLNFMRDTFERLEAAIIHNLNERRSKSA